MNQSTSGGRLIDYTNKARHFDLARLSSRGFRGVAIGLVGVEFEFGRG